jgi:hypothetical protein
LFPIWIGKEAKNEIYSAEEISAEFEFYDSSDETEESNLKKNKKFL